MACGSFLYRMLVAALSVLLLLSGGVLLRRRVDSARQGAVYEALSAQVARSREPAAVPAATEAAASILPEYAAIFEENPDLVGWLTIDGTCIDYPVMQTPDRKDYYLHRNFKREKNSHGCLYVRESCDVFAPSDNLTIYGHHMRDGSMFADLEKYRREDFRDRYPAIRFDTLYARHTYTVFAVFTTTASADGFAYHLFDDAANEAEFDGFVSACKTLSLYDTGITPEYGNKLICLSTCEYSHANGRLVVAAVRN